MVCWQASQVLALTLVGSIPAPGTRCKADPSPGRSAWPPSGTTSRCSSAWESARFGSGRPQVRTLSPGLADIWPSCSDGRGAHPFKVDTARVRLPSWSRGPAPCSWRWGFDSLTGWVRLPPGSDWSHTTTHARLAQWEERSTENAEVTGSAPVAGTHVTRNGSAHGPRRDEDRQGRSPRNQRALARTVPGRGVPVSSRQTPKAGSEALRAGRHNAHLAP